LQHIRYINIIFPIARFGSKLDKIPLTFVWWMCALYHFAVSEIFHILMETKPLINLHTFSLTDRIRSTLSLRAFSGA